MSHSYLLFNIHDIVEILITVQFTVPIGQISHHITSCHIKQHNTAQYHSTLHIKSKNVISYYVISYHITSSL